jgi:acetate kinase
MAATRILVLNPGSSSLKAALVEPPDTTIGRADASWGADASRSRDRAGGLRAVLRDLGLESGEGGNALDAVGYRVVHGGTRFSAPVLIDDDVVAGIESVADLAPLHNGVALETIAAGRELLPSVPHVACFDTAFHATLEPAAYRYPVPGRWFSEWGIRRFGFHGISVAWSVRRAAELLGGAADELCLTVAHLGSGCSVTAVEGGRSMDTSMGLTPLEGLMMGTRAGSIDPGVPFYLLGRGLLDAEQVSDELEHASGLLGVSGRTSDMRELLAAAVDGDESAELAVDMFVRRAAAGIAASATSLPRLDALVFTGGIGENAPEIRRRIVARLATLGLRELPVVKGVSGTDRRLDDGSGATAVLRIEAREDLVIAAQTASAVQGHPVP